MPIIYQCRHCGQEIGQLNQRRVDASMLGLDQLSADDTRDMIDYRENGDIKIKAICESCEASLESHPTYHELDHFLQ
ncbi:anti-sigma-F factor Fin [Lentibacillus halophilus]|uniref:Anti-sigma-F factor Fin n=1 Tax=Lentibacillus halophilus TaxID=295065 RepID=A0ABN0Z8Y6_9BACI